MAFSSVTSWQDGDPLTPTHLNAKADSIISDILNQTSFNTLTVGAAYSTSIRYPLRVTATDTTNGPVAVFYMPANGVGGFNDYRAAGGGVDTRVATTGWIHTGSGGYMEIVSAVTCSLYFGSGGDYTQPAMIVGYPGAVRFGKRGIEVGSASLGVAAVGSWTTDGTIGVAGLRSSVTFKVSSYSITTADHTVSMNSASTTTASLPVASTCTGQVFAVKRFGAGVVEVNAGSGGSIDNLSILTLGSQFSSYAVQSYGSGYAIIGRG